MGDASKQGRADVFGLFFSYFWAPLAIFGEAILPSDFLDLCQQQMDQIEAMELISVSTGEAITKIRKTEIGFSSFTNNSRFSGGGQRIRDMMLEFERNHVRDTKISYLQRDPQQKFRVNGSNVYILFNGERI